MCTICFCLLLGCGGALSCGGFFLDKRGCMNISPDCYPGLRASPLSRTDLSRWAILCLMWPEVIKSGPAGWCLPPPISPLAPFAGIYPKQQWLTALRGLLLLSLPWYGHWSGSICQLISAYSNSLPPGLGFPPAPCDNCCEGELPFHQPDEICQLPPCQCSTLGVLVTTHWP